MAPSQEEANPEGNQTITPDDKPATPSRIQRIFRKLIYLPYFVGIVWTCLHPMVSVITGELKCRGWYLDEHSIEIKFAEIKTWEPPAHLRIPLPSNPQHLSTLCDNLNTDIMPVNLVCHAHADHFDMALVVPRSNAVDPIEEAIVFVIPAPPGGDWTASTFHYTLLHSFRRMADPKATPWLAKTLIIVCAGEEDDLENTVSDFLDAYQGSRPQVGKQVPIVPPLPPKVSGALLRSLVVLDIDDQSNKSLSQIEIKAENLGQTQFAVLPQGRRGVLPNLDLVFLVGQLFKKAMYLQPRKYPESTFLAHGYVEQSKKIDSIVSNKELGLNSRVQYWAKELGDMALFAYTMVKGTYPPHAVALDRGLDAITIQAKFEGGFFRDPAVETIQFWELLVRALSNLHERLHHSHTLYWLPAPSRFVSHLEYFLPNILVLLPLAVRGFGLVLWDIPRLDMTTVGMSILVTTLTMAISSIVFGTTSDPSMIHSWLVGLYMGVALLWRSTVLSRPSSVKGTPAATMEELLQSLQFIACVTAAYTLVPIAFAHTALSYIPSLLWTPLLAFPNYGSRRSTLFGKLISVLLLIGTAPPVLVVPRLLETYTTFVQFAYIPLHLQFFLLVITSFLA